jgi:recombination protein RecA
MFSQGVSGEGCLLDMGVGIGLLQKTGAFYSFGDTRLGQGKENARDYLTEHKEVAQEIERQIRAVALPHQSPNQSDVAEQ